MADLHVFYDGEVDWYVAESATDAAAQQRELSGLTVEDQEWVFEQLPDDQSLKIWTEPDGLIGEMDAPGNVLVEKTCAEWVRQQGRGLLCSTEC